MSTRDLSHLCANIHEDDGKPMRRRSRSRRTTNTRKRDQLCAQIARAVQSTLPLLTHDPLLLALVVDRVYPAPDAAHLDVIWSLACTPDEPIDAALLQAKLHAITPTLRQHIARDIHRKRVPHLKCILHAGG